MAANMKKITEASDKLSAVLKSIEQAEKERNQFRKQRDDLNEDITALTQKITNLKTDLDISVDAIRKALVE